MALRFWLICCLVMVARVGMSESPSPGEKQSPGEISPPGKISSPGEPQSPGRTQSPKSPNATEQTNPADSNHSAVMPKKHRALISRYCFQCHDADTQEGNIDLESLSFDLRTLETAEMWHKVLGAMNAGEMPPESETQLTAAEKTEFLDVLSARVVSARQLLSDQGGEITMRRLNRREYANTICDLLNVVVDVKDLPNDENSGGFDTSGSALFLSSDQFEKYLQIGRQALDLAFSIDQNTARSVSVRRETEKTANQQIRSRLKNLTAAYERAQAFRASDKPATEFGFIDESRVAFEEGAYHRQSPPYQRYLELPETENGVVLITSFAGAMLDVTKIPNSAPAGKYILRIRAGALEGAPEDKRFLEYGKELEGARAGEMNVLGARYVSGTVENPEVIEIPIELSSASGRSLALRARQHNNRTAARRVYQAALAMGKPMPDPAIWVDWVELEGPIIDQQSPSPRDKILFRSDDEDSDAYAKRVITRFARRAFRSKSPAPNYVSRLMELYYDRRDAGEPFDVAIREPLSVVLASPSFLYLSEPKDSAATRKLTDRELSVRLSYFLWSSPPDAELRKLASRGELSQPAVLSAQVDRMLSSPRAAEFVSGFTHQWLAMDRLDFFQFDADRYPEFDDSVKAASRLEVYRTVETLINENLSITNLLDSDFVVINDLLASYYGIPGVQGAHFRKVSVPENQPRGGLLGTAAVLAMGSDGTRSSPVERGAWVMRKLLNDPPPPAPANVPQLSRLEDAALSARELQKAHQEEPQCAQCHRKIDPIGFGLENFDAAGRWRAKETVEIPAKNKRGKPKQELFAIDPSGKLPDGTTFRDFDDLRYQLSRHNEDFARGFTKALIEYGLGRPYSFSDEPLTQEIVDAAKVDDFAIRHFIHALVSSESFQTK
tara:strand:- start:65402 stop:68089 length:2688 start_codon:yes stop_codon:yes gene_type:complete